MGFQSCVPRLCAQKRNAYFPDPVKKTCSFVYTCPLKRYTVFPNYLLDVQRTRDMGTVFFTPLWQIECTSMATTAIKENDNFLYPQKKLCHFRDVQVHPRSAEIFSNNVIVRTSSHLPRQSNTRYTSVWVKRFQTTAASAILHESEMQVNCKQRLSW